MQIQMGARGQEPGARAPQRASSQGTEQDKGKRVQGTRRVINTQSSGQELGDRVPTPAWPFIHVIFLGRWFCHAWSQLPPLGMGCWTRSEILGLITPTVCAHGTILVVPSLCLNSHPSPLHDGNNGGGFWATSLHRVVHHVEHL